MIVEHMFNTGNNSRSEFFDLFMVVLLYSKGVILLEAGCMARLHSMFTNKSKKMLSIHSSPVTWVGEKSGWWRNIQRQSAFVYFSVSDVCHIASCGRVIIS
jgi:hypothetical protein